MPFAAAKARNGKRQTIMQLSSATRCTAVLAYQASFLIDKCLVSTHGAHLSFGFSSVNHIFL